MKFNQELITKARKGEIAILNDGSVEELREVLKEVWPQDDWLVGGACKYYSSHCMDDIYYNGSRETKKPAHSVKEFFMPDTQTIKGSEGGNEYIQINGGVDAEPENGKAYVGKPRTYKVTRQQMKEIWEAVALEGFKPFVIDVTRQFDPFEDFGVISEADVSTIVAGLQEKSVILRSIWPEYFHIPEREPVLCKDNLGHWIVGVSDGKGKAYVSFSYKEAQSYDQIIPFTKNPPK